MSVILPKSWLVQVGSLMVMCAITRGASAQTEAPEPAKPPPPAGGAESAAASEQTPPAEAPAAVEASEPPGDEVPPMVVAVPPEPADPPDALAELRAIDIELGQLEAERRKAGIMGPIAMTAAGFGSAVGLSALAISAFAVAENIADGDLDYDYDLNDDGFVDERDEDRARTVARIAAGVGSVGLAAGIGGTVWLARRLAKRSQYSPDIRGLRERRRELLYELRYGANLDADSMALTVSGRF